MSDDENKQADVELQQTQRKKQKQKKAPSVQKTSKTISKKTTSKRKRAARARKGRRQMSVVATNHSTHVATNTDGVSIVCTGSATVDGHTVSLRHPKAAAATTATKSFRNMRVDWARNMAKIDGKTMTIDQAIQQGYMTSDGSTVGQTSGVRSTVVNFF